MSRSTQVAPTLDASIPYSSHLHPRIHDALVGWEKQRVLYYAMSPHVTCIERLARTHLPWDQRGAWWSNLSIYVGASTIFIDFTLTTFSQVLPFLRAMHDANYRKAARMERLTSGFRWTWRVYLSTSHDAFFDIRFDADVPIDGATPGAACRRVRCGEETITVTKWKVVCDNVTAAVASLS